MIAAAVEMRISVVEFDPAGCCGRDDGDETLAAGAEGSARTVATRCGESCSSGGGTWILPRGGVRSGTLFNVTLFDETLFGGTMFGGTMAVETFPGGIGSAGALLRGIWLGGTGIGGTWLGGTWVSKTVPDGTLLRGIWLGSAPESFGALGRGT